MNEKVENNNNLSKFFKKVKNYYKPISIISVLCGLFIIVLLYLSYSKKEENIFLSDEFYKAKIMFENKNDIKAKATLLDIINKNNEFYSPLALYFMIENNLESNDQKIIELFNRVLSIKKDEDSNNLIRIKKALYLLEADTEKLILEELNPIINSESYLRKDAINLLISYFSSKNENNKANEYRNKLRSEFVK